VVVGLVPDGTGWVTINRADKANALTADMMGDLRGAIDRFGADPAVGAIVLRGAGERVFCAGVDVRTASPLPRDEAARLRSQRLFECLLSIIDCPKPVIAAVNGAASGGGCMLALVTDRLVAAAHAFFALPEIDLDIPTFAGLAVMQHLGGDALARDLVQTGRRMPAAEAVARGLVACAVEAAALDAQAAREAAFLAAKPQRSFALQKQWLATGLKDSLTRAEHASAEAKRRQATTAQ
jgi:enoyl-CoA hydratase/carnithine racemase